MPQHHEKKVNRYTIIQPKAHKTSGPIQVHWTAAPLTSFLFVWVPNRQVSKVIGSALQTQPRRQPADPSHSCEQLYHLEVAVARIPPLRNFEEVDEDDEHYKCLSNHYRRVLSKPIWKRVCPDCSLGASGSRRVQSVRLLLDLQINSLNFNIQGRCFGSFHAHHSPHR